MKRSWIASTSLVLSIWLAAPVLWAEEAKVYEGTWLTTNRKLDGTMTCVVTELTHNQWHGHFYGIWQEAPFSYRVTFSGPANNLQGTAVVDGADYVWSGAMTSTSLKGAFGGNRYAGSFDLKRKPRPSALIR